MILKIALLGKMRSGKDTAAEYLEKHYAFMRFAFGDNLKMVCDWLFPDRTKGKPRRLYQQVGQLMRIVDPYVWINQLDNRVKSFRSLFPHSNIVITDIRQPNEYEYAKKNGYLVVKIHADDAVRWERIRQSGDDCTEEDFNHETEKAIDNIPFDLQIVNNGTKEELYKQVGALIQKMQEGQLWDLYGSTHKKVSAYSANSSR